MTKKDFCLSDKLEKDWWEEGALLWAKDVKEFIKRENDLFNKFVEEIKVYGIADVDMPEKIRELQKKRNKLAGAKLTKEIKEVKENGNTN